VEEIGIPEMGVGLPTEIAPAAAVFADPTASQ
jgi:hypothetical protein